MKYRDVAQARQKIEACTDSSSVSNQATNPAIPGVFITKSITIATAMGEVLGITASLIAIIQLTGTVTYLGWGYISGVKRAPKDLRDLVDELNSLSKVLSVVQDLTASPNHISTALQRLDENDGPLQLCARDLEKLRLKLEPRGGFKGTMDNIMWPLKESETLQYIARLERHKSLFVLAMNADQMSLSRETGAYVQYTYSAIQDLRNGLDTNLATQNSQRLKKASQRIEEKRIQVLDWLFPEPFDKKHLDISRRRQKNTGRWLLKQSTFLQWVEEKLPCSLLWGHGIPGAGKTFLSSSVIDHLLALAPTENYGIAYIYFEYQEQDRQRPVNVICSLIKQLYTQTESLTTDIEALYDRMAPRNKIPTFEELYTALIAIFKSFTRVFFVFDALDECHQDNQRGDLLLFFHQLIKDGVNIFLTSRPHPEDIQETLSDYGATKIELSAREEDIETYIEAKIEKNVRARRLVRQGGCRERVLSELVNCAKGMFLLVHFHIAHLCQQTTAKQILKELDKLKNLSNEERPLDPTYDRAMENLRRQPKGSIELALKVFLWLVNARRTLSVEEIRIAVSIEKDQYELDELDIPDKATLLDACNGLVNIDDNNNIRLAHYTVQEYLLRNQVIPQDAVPQIAIACATYLSFGAFSDGPCKSPNLLRDRLRLHPFFGYSSLNLSFHLANCNESLTTETILRFIRSSGNALSYIQIFLTFSNPATGTLDCMEIDRNYLWTMTTVNIPEPRHPLYIASVIGHSTAVRLLLEEEYYSLIQVEVDVREALCVAASQGHESVVRILLESGFGFCVPNAQGYTSLWLALRRTQNRAVASLLIQKGADISVPDQSGKTLLHWAVILGREAIFQYLLEHGSDLSVSDNDGLTALHHAVFNGRNSMAQQLIVHGANITAMDKSGWTIVHWAAFSGNKPMVHQLLEISPTSIPSPIAYQDAVFDESWSPEDRELVELLLERMSDPSVPGKNGDTGLHRAAKSGRTKAVELLLERGLDASVPNKYGITPLMHAAAEGHDSIVKILLDSGAALSDRDDNSRTPLHWAVKGRKESAVTLLLDSGADSSIMDNDGSTPLHAAVSSPGDLGIIKRLLDNGADLRTSDKSGCTALHIAAFPPGNPEITKLLLDNGAKTSAVDRYGRTALHVSASSQDGDLEVLKLLLDRGSNTSTVDKNGRTALHLAASSPGGLEIVKVLLDNGANANIVDKDRRTPLHLAVINGFLEIVKALCKSSDTSIVDKDGRTALHLASTSQSGFLVVKTLLDNGADTCIVDKDGRTPLQLIESSPNPCPVIIRMLLGSSANTSIVDKDRHAAQGLSHSYASHSAAKPFPNTDWRTMAPPRSTTFSPDMDWRAMIPPIPTTSDRRPYPFPGVPKPRRGSLEPSQDTPIIKPTAD